MGEWIAEPTPHIMILVGGHYFRTDGTVRFNLNQQGRTLLDQKSDQPSERLALKKRLAPSKYNQHWSIILPLLVDPGSHEQKLIGDHLDVFQVASAEVLSIAVGAFEIASVKPDEDRRHPDERPLALYGLPDGVYVNGFRLLGNR
jgi:hypothetical protein